MKIKRTLLVLNKRNKHTLNGGLNPHAPLWWLVNVVVMVVLVDLRWWWRHGCGDVGDDVNGVEMVVGWCWRSGKGSGDGGCSRGGSGVWKWWVASDLWLVGWRYVVAARKKLAGNGGGASGRKMERIGSRG
ncbi:hypothetical protein Tco_0095425 [Tanacetum coccineum]